MRMRQRGVTLSCLIFVFSSRIEGRFNCPHSWWFVGNPMSRYGSSIRLYYLYYKRSTRKMLESGAASLPLPVR
jgi:hypothetical protein